MNNPQHTFVKTCGPAEYVHLYYNTKSTFPEPQCFTTAPNYACIVRKKLLQYSLSIEGAFERMTCRARL